MRKISALLLCAGRSLRMGSFKPLLKLDELSVVERCVENLLPLCESVVVVTGKNAEQVEEVLCARFKEKIRFVRNDDFASTDMLHSVRLGLYALPKCDCFFLQPADIPLVSKETPKKLLADLKDADVIFPSYQGRRGHPVLMCSSLIPDVLSYEGADGMRGFFRTVKKRKTVEVDDEGILLDLDTPEDYRKSLDYLNKCNRNIR